MPMDRDYKAALRWVNARRALADMPVLLRLPRWRGCICPLELALWPRACRVTHTAVWFKENGRLLVIRLPDAVESFMIKLDAGHYDDLLAPAETGCDRDLHIASCPESVTSRLARLRAMP